VWSKIPVLVDAFKRFPHAKWLWWLDFDAIIMSPKVDLTSLVLGAKSMYSVLRKGEDYRIRGKEREGVYHTPANPSVDDIHLLISGDHNGINAGSFFLRRSDWTEKIFLDLWLDPFYIDRDWAGKEQDALIHIIEHHKFIRQHVGILPQRTINAYSEGGDEMGWRPGDLVVHFAGCWYTSAITRMES